MADAPPFEGLHPHLTQPRLAPLGPEAWTVRSPLKLMGVHFGTRMTVVRLADGSLWLHSPIPLTRDVQLEVDGLGPVAHIVAPSLWHHLFAGDWADAYPDAQLWVAPNLVQTKRPDLAERARTLPADAPDAWAGQIDQVLYDAAPKMNEMVFLHRASGSLLLCDLCMNFRTVPWRFSRIALGLYGAMNYFGPTRSIKWLTKDRARARAILDEIATWDFERVSVCHGEVMEEDAKTAFFANWTWVPAAPGALGRAGA